MSDCGARDPANREREERGRLPSDERTPLGPAVGVSLDRRAVKGPG